jgi:transcription elongation GreA/GreB family factor
MRLPTRKSEELRASKTPDEDRFFTEAAIEDMKQELKNLLSHERQDAAAEVRRLAELGDFSENAAYQMAKGHLRRVNARIVTLEERLKKAIPIKKGAGPNGQVRLGSHVTVETNDSRITFDIVGAHETDPSAGRISYLSPLGHALMGRRAGETISLYSKDHYTAYNILSVS